MWRSVTEFAITTASRRRRRRRRRRRYRTTARGKLTVLIFHVHFRGRVLFHEISRRANNPERVPLLPRPGSGFCCRETLIRKSSITRTGNDSIIIISKRGEISIARRNTRELMRATRARYLPNAVTLSTPKLNDVLNVFLKSVIISYYGV